jgi:cytochrome c556
MTKTALANLIGFIGVALLLVAFLLNTFRLMRADGRPYTLLNLAGASLAGYSSYLISFMPFVILEGTWAAVAAVALFRASRRPSAIAVVLLMLIPPLSVGEARQSGQTPTSKAIVPVAASTLAASPDRYYGEPVSVTGAVERSLSRLAFSIDQDSKSSTGHDILVLARILNSPVEPGTYVTVLGQAVRFSQEEIATKAKDYITDLPVDVVESFRGRPAILATAVINHAGVDLAMRLPPPMTADEAAHAKIMKQVGPANAALRKALEAKDGKLAHENAAMLRRAFAETGDFWRSRKRADAVDWARDAQKAVDAIDRLAAEGNWDEVKSSATALGQACQACHTAYRERYDDGSYRFKADKLQPRSLVSIRRSGTSQIAATRM